MKLLLPLFTTLLHLTHASPFPSLDPSTTSLYPEYHKIYIERTPSTFNISTFLGPESSTDQTPLSPLNAGPGENLVACLPLDPSIPAQGIYHTIDTACSIFREQAYHTARGFSYSFRLEAAHDGPKGYDLIFGLHNPVTARENSQLFHENYCIQWFRQAQQICVDKYEMVRGGGRRLPMAMFITINQDGVVVYDLILTVRLKVR